MHRVHAVCRQCHIDAWNTPAAPEPPPVECVEFCTNGGQSDDPVMLALCETHLAKALGLLIAPQAVAFMNPPKTSPEFTLPAEYYEGDTTTKFVFNVGEP